MGHRRLAECPFGRQKTGESAKKIRSRDGREAAHSRIFPEVPWTGTVARGDKEGTKHNRGPGADGMSAFNRIFPVWGEGTGPLSA